MKQLRSNQDGIVTVVVTVLVMIVISITTIGMAKLAAREQRQALDRQLSAQAYYSADSGINDVIAEIKANRLASNISQCAPPAGVGAKTLSQISNPTLSPNKNDLVLDSVLSSLALQTQVKSSYPCVLVNFNPSSLEYAQVTTDSAVVADVTVTDAAGVPGGNAVQKIVIGWEDAAGGIGFRSAAACNNLNATDTTPMLKLDITPLEGPSAAGNTYSRDDLMRRTVTYYLNPCTGATPFYTDTSWSLPATTVNTSSGQFVSGNCDANPAGHTASTKAPLRCNVNIAITGGGANRFLVRAKPIYRTAKVTVLGLDSTDTPQYLKGGQTVIDVTGKAQDVVKRTQVRVSNRSPYLYAIESTGSVCKRLIAVQPPENSLTGVPSPATSNNPVDAQICRAAQD